MRGKAVGRNIAVLTGFRVDPFFRKLVNVCFRFRDFGVHGLVDGSIMVVNLTLYTINEPSTVNGSLVVQVVQTVIHYLLLINLYKSRDIWRFMDGLWVI